ncbi:MAG TPA: WecB/TagA/CpsF family glycosyltransferase [Blastocatellia bacterium]|nr:WecB/TagA/CpsF family glycosyltransferase [Blastocatellia bacterium]
MTTEATGRRGDGDRGRGGDVVAPSPPRPVSPSHPLSVRSSVIAGIPVANLTEDEAVDAIEALLSDGGSHYGAVVNAAKIVAANRDDKLKQVLRDADLVTADGMSIVWASRLLGQRLKERVTGIDLFERLVERAADRGLSVYFLGAREASVRGTVERFTNRYPTLRVSGYRDGYFDASQSDSVCECIRLSGAVLLFVAMGSPAQENWIASNLALTGARFALGVGGSFDHLSGRARRAPQWMQKSGLEWLHRLAQEPGRLWRRYLIGNTAFVWLVIRERLRGPGTAEPK